MAISMKELTRAGVLARVAAGTLTLGAAAAVMAVSYRQAKRLYQRYRIVLGDQPVTVLEKTGQKCFASRPRTGRAAR